jgi:hypothetical protein
MTKLKKMYLSNGMILKEGHRPLAEIADEIRDNTIRMDFWNYINNTIMRYNNDASVCILDKREYDRFSDALDALIDVIND